MNKGKLAAKIVGALLCLGGALLAWGGDFFKGKYEEELIKETCEKEVAKQFAKLTEECVQNAAE